MKREERKRRFNEAIVNMLFPSLPPPQHQPHVESLTQDSDSDFLSGALDEHNNGNASTSADEQEESETGKLTRAQRKRIRKKKMKEETLRRGKLIGPLLPLNHQVPEDAPPPPVRSNASKQGAESVKKMKHRRMAKRLAKEKPNASASHNNNHKDSLEGPNTKE